jgi:hypothetical protein
MRPYPAVSSAQAVAYITGRVCSDPSMGFSLDELTDALREEIPPSGGYKAGAIFKKKAQLEMGPRVGLSKEEFRKLMQTTMSHLFSENEHFDDVFARVDQDRNGTIDVDELATFLGDPRIRLHRRLLLSVDSPI